MNNTKEINSLELRDLIGPELFAISNEYIITYFMMCEEQYTDTVIDIKIIDHEDGTFSVYESLHGLLINRIGMSINEKIVLPIGILSSLAARVEDRIRLPEEDIIFLNSIYHILSFIRRPQDGFKIDIYLYYLGMTVAYLYNLNHGETIAHMTRHDYVTIEGFKDEIVFLDGDMEYERVVYIIELFSNRSYIKIRKAYESDVPDYEFRVKIDDIINSAIDGIERP